jgi:hypothetical protein
MLSPEMRRARNLYHEWRLMPEPERGQIAASAALVKGLALDLRGRLDAARGERELAGANDRLRAALDACELRRAA